MAEVDDVELAPIGAVRRTRVGRKATEPMRKDIRLLGDILGDTIREQNGDEVFALVERARLESFRIPRSGVDRAALAHMFDGMDIHRAIPVIRALTQFSLRPSIILARTGPRQPPRRGVSPPAPGGPYRLVTRQLGALPVIDWFCARLGLGALLEAFVQHDDVRLKLAPATAIGVVVRNLALAREPVYALGRWAEPFDPVPLGLADGEAGLLNDDRVGRMLARLFDSLLTRLVLDAVARFGIDCSQLHNDSTSVTVTGRYPGADGRVRGGKPTAAITFGHNKDHRPDLKQLVWILTVTADGAVPLAHRVVDGNTSDDVTHVDTWDHLVGHCQLEVVWTFC